MNRYHHWLFALCFTLTAPVYGSQILTFNNPFEMKVQNNGQVSTLGADVASYGLDGGNPVAGDPSTGPGDSAHAYDFLRFDNLFGSDLGQVPAGATILSATLTMTTAVSSNAQSGGVFGVAPLLAPFSASNIYSDYTGAGTGYDAGPSWVNGYTGRPTGGFSGMTAQGSTAMANVTLALQKWSADPSSAYGFSISARTTDGWGVETVGSSNVDHRPTLTVEYTTAPTTIRRFQEGTNGYVGATMQRIGSDGITADGATLSTTYLDGPNGTDSFDVQALVKFDNVFGELSGQVAPGDTVLRAYLVLTTGATTESHSGGSFDIHQMLVNWDGTSTFDSFGTDGPTIDQNEIGAPLSSVRGMTQGSQILFDVTSAVQAWQSGTDNFGLNIQSNTTDGWNIFWNGASDPSLRPELVVITTVPEPVTALMLLCGGMGWLGFRRPRNR